MAVLFLEPGTDATFDLSFYTSIGGTVTSDSGQAQTGPRSLKFDSGAGAALATVALPTAATPAAGTGNLSVAVRLASLPAGVTTLLTFATPQAIFGVTVSAAGVLQLATGATLIGSPGSTLTAGTWTHFSVGYNITSTTVNSLVLFLGTNPVADITVTNATLNATALGKITLGIVSGTPGANLVVNMDDVFVSDAGSLTNSGDIRVTAKRPNTNYQGGFDTAIGTNSANRASNVNERALSLSNGWQQSAPLQTARPASDITTTGWTFTGAATAWAATSEAVADDDTSYAVRASTGTLECKLSPLNAPGVTADHVFFCRLECPDGASAVEKATISLVQGTTIIASSASTTLSRVGYANISTTLTALQAGAISDYTDLRVRVVVDAAGASEHIRVTQLYFQAPQATAACADETYQVQGWTGGDVDLSGATLVGRTAWGWVAKSAADGTGEGLWADGTLAVSTFPTTAGLVTVTDALDKYPSADQGIGVHASNASASTSLYECGWILAYLPVLTMRLYLRLADVAHPTAGEHSAALPSGTLLDTAPTDMALLPVRGTSERSLSWSTLGQTGAQANYAGRFVSAGLQAQTIGANTWTITGVAVEGGANANAFLAVSLYVWRPSTGAVVGYIYDSAAALGSEWGTTRAYLTNTFTGSAVTAANADLLVLEIWQVATQADTSVYSESFFFDGGTGGSGTDAAPYLETPQTLSFAGSIAGSNQVFLRNLAAPQSPAANTKSLVLPSGTLDVSANGTANEREAANFTAGAAQVAVTWNSLAQTTAQCSYLARFSSAALAAQTLNAGTWTLAFGAQAASLSAASKLALSLFVWRPKTAAVVGRLYDSATALGTVWPVAEAGIVVTFSGTALTVQTGDLLCLEVWQVATQSAATAFSNSFFIEGTTPPVQGTATSAAGTNLTAPQTLLFQTYARLGSRVFALPVRERDDG